MKIIDITQTISEQIQVYPGDPKPKIKKIKTTSEDGVLLTSVFLGSHTGTHIDSPAHYIEGAKTLDEMPLIFGPARVVEGDLSNASINQDDIVLIRGRSEITFKEAEFLITKKIKAVGIDSLSIGSEEVHKTLLSKDIQIIEGLDLSKAEPAIYTIFCLPLKVKGVEAAPARCVLIKDD